MQPEIHTPQAFKYHWVVWRVCGLQQPKNPAWINLYSTYAVVFNATVTLLFSATLIINCCLSENLDSLCENLYVTITDMVSNVKFINVFIMRKQFLEIRSILEKLDRRAKLANERKCLKEGIGSAHFCFIAFFRIYCCAIITSQLVVYSSQESRLMYPAWFPFDWRSSRRNFLIAHFYQLFGLIVKATQNLASDTYPQAYLSILSAHIKALSLRIRHIGAKSTNCPRRNQSQMDANYKGLIECIEDHKDVTKLYKVIQNIISGACLTQFIGTGLALCTIGIYLLYIGLDYAKLLNTAFFVSAVTLEMFILCYSGDRLCQESEALSDAIYSCPWSDQNRDFKKVLQVFLIRSQKMNVIMAGNIIPVRIPTCVQVVKTAYSVFTVLKEVK